MSEHFLVGLKSTFEAAHFIPDHDKCGCIHGHSYHVETLYSRENDGLDSQGMVIDFHTLKEVEDNAIMRYDHKMLNRIMSEIPTAEQIAKRLFLNIENTLKEKGLTDVRILRVRVSETETGFAEYIG